MANNFNIGDIVRYTGSDPAIPDGATGRIIDLDLFFPGSLLAQNDTEGYVLGLTQEEVELIAEGEVDETSPVPAEAPAAELAVGDRVELVNNYGVIAPQGAHGTVTAIPHPISDGFDLQVEFAEEEEDGNTYTYKQGVKLEQVRKVRDEVFSATEKPVVGTRVVVTGFDPRLASQAGTVLDVADPVEMYLIGVDGDPGFVKGGYPLERGEFEILTPENDPAKDADDKAADLLADWELELLYEPKVTPAEQDFLDGNEDPAFEDFLREVGILLDEANDDRLTDTEVQNLAFDRFNAAAAAITTPMIREGLALLAMGFALEGKDASTPVLRALLGKD